MSAIEHLLPNPFTFLQAAPEPEPEPDPNPEVAEIVEAIELELQAFLDRPPLFLRLGPDWSGPN
jgi:hypothetical protein